MVLMIHHFRCFLQQALRLVGVGDLAAGRSVIAGGWWRPPLPHFALSTVDVKTLYYLALFTRTTCTTQSLPFISQDEAEESQTAASRLLCSYGLSPQSSVLIGMRLILKWKQILLSHSPRRFAFHT